MPTRAKKRRTDDRVPPARVIIAGYELDDQAIDQVIEMTFRTFERMMTSENVIRLLHLYAEAQKKTAFS